MKYGDLTFCLKLTGYDANYFVIIHWSRINACDFPNTFHYNFLNLGALQIHRPKIHKNGGRTIGNVPQNEIYQNFFFKSPWLFLNIKILFIVFIFSTIIMRSAFVSYRRIPVQTNNEFCKTNILCYHVTHRSVTRSVWSVERTSSLAFISQFDLALFITMAANN